MTIPLPPPPPTPPAAGVSHCYRHPDREAWVRCVRCDRPICPDCMRPAAVGHQCPDDAAADRRGQRPRRTAVGVRTAMTGRPWATWALLAANVAVYALTAAQSRFGIDEPGGSRLFLDWELRPAALQAEGSYYRLLTAAFLHANLVHIGVNMLSLLFIGPAVERFLGRPRYLALYVLSALGGSSAVYAFGAPEVPVVGASGALFGLLGTCLVLARRMGLDVTYLIGIIALNFAFTFSVGGISRLGHIGGFVTGLLVAVALAGWPPAARRRSTSTQVTGLAVVAAVVVAVVVVRAATF